MKSKTLAFLILAIGLISACSTVKKVKEKDSLQLTEATASEITTVHSDSSSTFNSRSYKGITPEFQDAYLKSFEISMGLANGIAATANLSGNTDDMVRAMNAVNSRSNEMFNLLKSGVLGYDETSSSKNAKNDAVKAKDEKQSEQTEEHFKKEKTPDINMYLLLVGAAILIILIAVGLFVYRLWKRMKAVSGIFNAVKQ